MTYDQYRDHVGFTPDVVIDALIRAGLGDVEQKAITREQFDRAMDGQVVKERKANPGDRHRGADRTPRRKVRPRPHSRTGMYAHAVRKGAR